MISRINVNISEDMHAAIQRQAKRRGATMSGLIRLILTGWLEDQGETGSWDVPLPGGYRPSDDHLTAAEILERDLPKPGTRTGAERAAAEE